MIGRWLTASGLAAGAALATMMAGHAQQPAPKPQDVPIFRTGTSLVTVDAVVVDDDGRHVTDLGAADFEVVHEGRVLPTRQAVYVTIGNASGAASSGPSVANEPAIDGRRPGREPGGGCAPADRRCAPRHPGGRKPLAQPQRAAWPVHAAGDRRPQAGERPRPADRLHGGFRGEVALSFQPSDAPRSPLPAPHSTFRLPHHDAFGAPHSQLG